MTLANDRLNTTDPSVLPIWTDSVSLFSMTGSGVVLMLTQRGVLSPLVNESVEDMVEKSTLAEEVQRRKMIKDN